MSDFAPAQEPQLEPAAPANVAMRVELVMDHYRVCGEVRTNVPRRLADVLNSADLPYIIIHDGELDDPIIDDDVPRGHKLIQVGLDSLQFAIPRTETQVKGDPFEVIEKTPVRVTITMLGFEIVGSVYMVPGLDPASSQLLGSNHFIPMTDATIIPASNPKHSWHEDVIVVNLGRALIFAPH